MAPLPFLIAALLQWTEPVNPYPRAILGEEEVARWTFEKGVNGFAAEHQCSLKAEDGNLKIHSTGDDPYLSRNVGLPGGELVLRLKMKAKADGRGGVYWTTDRSPRRGEDKAQSFPIEHDGKWHDCQVVFSAPGKLVNLRLDPGGAPGEIEIASIHLTRRLRHPLSIEKAESGEDRVRFTLKNKADHAITALARGQTYPIPAEAEVAIDVPTVKQKPLEPVTLEVAATDNGKPLPNIHRTVFVHHPKIDTKWLVLPLDEDPSKTPPLSIPASTRLQLASDGSVGRLWRDNQLLAVIGPMVHRDGQIPALKSTQNGPTIQFDGDGVSLLIAAAGSELLVSITSDQPCEGPVVRAVGRMEQGILAGVEYLDRDEASSSTLDVETEQHIRFAPDPLDVTMPLMAFVTEHGSIAMTWRNMDLQPVFATPNFFDGTPDHRMAMRGKRIDVTLGVLSGPLEDCILWAVRRNGLPPLPAEARTEAQQWELCRKALSGPIRSEAGWGHCIEPRFKREPFADIASAWWRLNDELPALPRWVPHGAHVPNDAIYFASGKAAEWLEIQNRQAKALIAQQKPDGSYRYDGPYRRGHYEDTANGICARPAALLLEHARMTGNRDSLAAGLRTLEYMKRFRTPRGAQIWEIPLHTPDQLASAYAVWACVRGYELTRDRSHLAEACSWAITGVPFTYLWGRYPVMSYATPPVLGATNWRSPLWIGLPVQWVGGVYAYYLTLLAPYDNTLDWKKLAQGILITAEQMQYPDGPNAGLLPDSFVLASQSRQPSNINPAALVSLRLALDGRVDSLAVAVDGNRRAVAPFPVSIKDGKIRVQGRRGVKYQILVDGAKVIDVDSQGEDVLPLP